MSFSESGLILFRPGSTARVKRPNLVIKPTLPWDTVLYGFGHTMQQGIAPSVPMMAPAVLIIEPYQPWASSLSSPLITRAYDGWRSSRRGGCTLTIGTSSRAWLLLPLIGAFPRSLIVVVVECIVDRSAARGRRESDVVWSCWVDDVKWTIQTRRWPCRGVVVLLILGNGRGGERVSWTSRVLPRALIPGSPGQCIHTKRILRGRQANEWAVHIGTPLLTGYRPWRERDWNC